jgi:hypothetical protein
VKDHGTGVLEVAGAPPAAPEDLDPDRVLPLYEPEHGARRAVAPEGEEMGHVAVVEQAAKAVYRDAIAVGKAHLNLYAAVGHLLAGCWAQHLEQRGSQEDQAPGSLREGPFSDRRKTDRGRQDGRHQPPHRERWQQPHIPSHSFAAPTLCKRAPIHCSHSPSG